MKPKRRLKGLHELLMRRFLRKFHRVHEEEHAIPGHCRQLVSEREQQILVAVQEYCRELMREQEQRWKEQEQQILGNIHQYCRVLTWKRERDRKEQEQRWKEQEPQILDDIHEYCRRLDLENEQRGLAIIQERYRQMRGDRREGLS
jgi:hypothetical protein